MRFNIIWKILFKKHAFQKFFKPKRVDEIFLANKGVLFILISPYIKLFLFENKISSLLFTYLIWTENFDRLFKFKL